MRELLLRCLLAFLSLSFLGGCAFTTSVVKVDFTPPIAQHVDIDAVVVVQTINDARGVDPKFLAQKGVRGKTTGVYLATEEVTQIVTDAIRQTLKAMNYRIDAAQGDLILTGDILKFESEVQVGFWSGDLEGSIQISLRLTDAKDGGMVWAEILSANYKKTGLQFDGEGHRKEVAEKTLQAATKKLADSPTFRSAVERFQRVKRPGV